MAPAAVTCTDRVSTSAQPGFSERAPGSSSRARRVRWSVALPVAIALVTITGAGLTYLSIRQESTAVDHDRRAVVQTVLVQARHTGASAQTHAFGGLAAQYRAMLAEAEAMQDADPERAATMRALARSFGTKALIYDYMTGSGESLRFDYEAQLQAALRNSDAIAPPENQPELTAARAREYHDRARVLALTVVGMLAVVVLLMVARMTNRNTRRVPLAVAAAVGYLVALGFALPNAL